jgi:hypothetical protein
MNDARRYRQKAAECLETAEHISDHGTRMALVAMAESWIRLAEQADRNSLNDLVYETPAQRTYGTRIQ